MIDSKMSCDDALQKLQKDICKFYAENFSKGDIKTAKKELEGF